jgi:hypothetical protein
MGIITAFFYYTVETLNFIPPFCKLRIYFKEITMQLKMYVSLLTAFVVLLFAVSELPLKAEAVFLKDGSIVDGIIESDSAEAVTVRLSDKKRKQILRKDIIRILYTELKMSKIYIQKRDGEGLVAYMVDEDSELYPFFSSTS